MTRSQFKNFTYHRVQPQQFIRDGVNLLVIHDKREILFRMISMVRVNRYMFKIESLTCMKRLLETLIYKMNELYTFEPSGTLKSLIKDFERLHKIHDPRVLNVYDNEDLARGTF
jgi:hypothetical protein